MRKWIINLSLFLLPLFCYGVAFEWYCRNKTIFGVKRRYALAHLSTVKTIYTGTSHIEKGVRIPLQDAQYLNWAAPGQTFAFEYHLLKKYLPEMSSIQTVCIEMSPTRIYLYPKPDDWSANVYWIHYGIPYSVNVYNPIRSSHLLQSYAFFKDMVHDAWNPFKEHLKIDDTGFAPDDFKDRFWSCQFDTAQIQASFKMKYDFKLSESLIKSNLNFLDSTLTMLRRHNIQTVLIVPPFYETFNRAIPPLVKARFDRTLSEIMSQSMVSVFNFNRPDIWEVSDYYNDNHLNPKGAQKWFAMLQDSINQIGH